jgi:hypothetical protein
VYFQVFLRFWASKWLRFGRFWGHCPKRPTCVSTAPWRMKRMSPLQKTLLRGVENVIEQKKQITTSKFDFWGTWEPPKSNKIKNTGPRALQKSLFFFKVWLKGRFWTAFGTRLFFKGASGRVFGGLGDDFGRILGRFGVRGPQS